MIELYRSPWRTHFERALDGVRKEILIASPFITRPEADQVCERLARLNSDGQARVQVMTDLRAESVLAGSLDIEALRVFQTALDSSEIVNLPHLHAKVYVFDSSLAIVGSANLTTAGLESNYEYNVGIRDPRTVQDVKRDMEAYALIGNILLPGDLDELSQVAQELSHQYRTVLRSAAASARARFNDTLNKANVRFAEALVGARSAHALFSQAIFFVLSKGPLETRSLHPYVQRLLPELCDDTVELIIHGERFGKAWKHHVRNAQQYLKKKGLIAFDGRTWNLVR